ncbi:hypothetical protein Avbf_10783 [Armadillidium vulgare]|nr:hypothetical protein Avbf_10783 [Armadillidium vulgare]
MRKVLHFTMSIFNVIICLTLFSLCQSFPSSQPVEGTLTPSNFHSNRRSYNGYPPYQQRSLERRARRSEDVDESSGSRDRLNRRMRRRRARRRSRRN